MTGSATRSTTAPVVVGVDGSASSQDAVRWAATEAALRRVPLQLAAAYALPIDATGSVLEPASFFADRESAARQVLSAAAELAAATAHDIGPLYIDRDLVCGPTVPYLLDLARTARMVVLGSRGLGEVTGALLGSVTTAVATHADCPVAVIRGMPATGATALEGPVVVGVDGSEHSAPAIAQGFEEASLRGVDLVAVHAWSDVSLRSVFSGADEPRLDWAAIRTAQQAVLSESMSGWREQHPDVTVREVVVQDRPARHLEQHVGDAQLVVVGSRGRGGFTSMLLGSTSRTLLHTATRPLLVVARRR